MTETNSIRIWLHDDVPSHISKVIPNFDDAYEPTGYCVCHVPKSIQESEPFQLSESLPPIQLARDLTGDERIKWLPMAGNYLFGTNACDVFDHPDGNGLLIVFSNI